MNVVIFIAIILVIYFIAFSNRSDKSVYQSRQDYQTGPKVQNSQIEVLTPLIEKIQHLDHYLVITHFQNSFAIIESHTGHKFTVYTTKNKSSVEWEYKTSHNIIKLDWSASSKINHSAFFHQIRLDLLPHRNKFNRFLFNKYDNSKIQRELMELHSTLYKGLKDEAESYLSEKHHSYPRYLNFVFDCYIIAVIKTFMLDEPDSLKLDIETATDFILSRNEITRFNKVFTPSKIKTTYPRRTNINHSLGINEFRTLFSNNLNSLTHNKEKYRKFIKKLILGFSNEQIAITKSFQQFSSNGKVISAEHFYISLFVHPTILLDYAIKEKLYKILQDEIEDFDYAKLIIKLGKKYKYLMEKSLYKEKIL